MLRLLARLCVSAFAAIASLLITIENASIPSVVFALEIYDEVKISPSDAVNRSAFGYSPAVGPNTVAVGSLGNSQPYGPGAVHVFLDVIPAGTWNYLVERMITASAGTDQDDFGFNIALEERTITVSAHGFSDYSGAVYVFQDTSMSGDWSSYDESEILPSDGVTQDAFGHAVDIEGGALLVGARVRISSAGKAYIFLDSNTKHF